MSASDLKVASEHAEIEDTAADWIARRQAGLSARAERSLQEWLQSDSRHAAIYQELERVWQAVSLSGDRDGANLALQELHLREKRRSARRRRIVHGAFAGLAAAAALVIAFLPESQTPVPPALPAPTIAFKPDLRGLPDGSTVELNAGAEIEVVFEAQRRTVRLLCGEAVFNVAKDAERPFVVEAGSVRVRAVGTAFAVRLDTAAVDVLVTEGEVAVERVSEQVDEASHGSRPLTLVSGGKVSIPTDASRLATVPVQPVSAAELSKALAWRGRRVEFTQTPLSEAVQLFNAQNELKLTVGDTAVGDFRISGIFWSDDPEGFLRLLEAGFSVQSERVGDRIVLRSR